MSGLSDLPELSDLIARVPGAVYEFANLYWVGAEQVNGAEVPPPGIELYDDKGVGRKGDLIRVGFKLYEIVGYEGSFKAYRLRPFKATLTQTDLLRLSGQQND